MADRRFEVFRMAHREPTKAADLILQLEAELRMERTTVGMQKAQLLEREGKVMVDVVSLAYGLNCLSIDNAMNVPDYELAEQLLPLLAAHKEGEQDAS
jgi:hypothetical protein